MKILALEFSSARRSVAAVIPGQEPVEAVAETPERQTHAFDLINQALTSARIERNAVECIAVGIGPGSYTGIRVGISIAQGWELATGVKILGISSADALAEQARRGRLYGRIACVIDAQRQEFYVGDYELSGPGASCIEPVHIETLAQVTERLVRGEVLVSPDNQAPHKHLIFPTALALSQLALGRSDFVPGEHLEPIYLRETAFVKAPPARIGTP
jgi:tRNA threonylcarbamoyladenosine biosynthesis protein TsaB